MNRYIMPVTGSSGTAKVYDRFANVFKMHIPSNAVKDENIHLSTWIFVTPDNFKKCVPGWRFWLQRVNFNLESQLLSLVTSKTVLLAKHVSEISTFVGKQVVGIVKHCKIYFNCRFLAIGTIFCIDNSANSTIKKLN